MKLWGVVYTNWRNWWLIPVDLLTSLFYWISYGSEKVASSLNWFVIRKVKRRRKIITILILLLLAGCCRYNYQTRPVPNPNKQFIHYPK